MELTSPNKTQIRPERAEQLQFLRFLAFLNVYICHAEVWLFFKYPASHCAAAAVSFFFMLSGLVIGYSMFGKEISLSWKNQGAYMWKKVKRVYPLYFLTTVFSFLFYVIPGIVAAGDWKTLAGHTMPLAANLLMVQTWVQGVTSYNSVSWFMATTMFLYLFALPGMAVLNRVGKGRFPVLWLGGIFFVLMVVITAYCRLTWPYNMDYLQYTLPPARLVEFLMGMILGYGVRYVKPYIEKVKLAGLLATVLEVFALCFWVFCLRRPGNYWMNRIISWIIPNTVLLTVFAFGMGWVSALFRKKSLVRLGDISFPCYLIHNILVVRYVINNPAPETVIGKVIPFFTCLLLTVLISLMLMPKMKKTG